MMLVSIDGEDWHVIGTAYDTVVGLRYASSLTRSRAAESYSYGLEGGGRERERARDRGSR